jgi:malonyl-CoA decarboxylase
MLLRVDDVGLQRRVDFVEVDRGRDAPKEQNSLTHSAPEGVRMRSPARSSAVTSRARSNPGVSLRFRTANERELASGSAFGEPPESRAAAARARRPQGRPARRRKQHVMEAAGGSDQAREATAERQNLAALWQRLVRLGSANEDLSERQHAALLATLRLGLESHAGEQAIQKQFSEIADRYRQLSRAGRLHMLQTLAAFDVDAREITVLAADYAGGAPSPERADVRRRLRKAIEGPRTTLLRCFNTVPDGVKFLVDMRADLLEETGDPRLAELEGDLKALLISWFDYGFLKLQRITWDAPASLLERLARYEAVHEMRGWADLKNRLDSDRRCYAFFHPAMPQEPLIFIEAALMNELPAAVAPLLDSAAPVGNPSEASVAVFYSISNCQRGLDGISFGNAMIKRVVGEVTNAFPNIRRFGTLSPLPGFRSWLERAHAGSSDPESGLLSALSNRRWHRDGALSVALREPLLRLCAHYLLEEKRSRHRALDPVADFHLSNGASIERINWLGDTSRRGIQESAGMMVNYLYRLDRIEANQSAYRSGHIEASAAVAHLRTLPNNGARQRPRPAQ